MSQQHSDLGSAAAHPSAELLLDHHHGRLGLEDRKEIERHLSDCSECTRIVLDLGGQLQEPDPKLATSWNALRSRIDGADGSRDSDPGQERKLATARRSWLRGSLAVAAVILAVVSLAAWSFLQQQRHLHVLETRVAELERLLTSWSGPQTAVSGIDLLPAGALRKPGAAPVLEVPAEARFLIVRLILLSPSTAEAFDLGFFDQGGESLAELRGVRKDALGNVTFALPRGFLPEGTYRLKLYGSGAKAEPEAEFALRLSYDEP